MKKILAAIILTLSLNAMAADQTLGLGAVLGAPTGLSLNYYLKPTRTLHTVFAYDLDGDDEVYLASHYTIRKPNSLHFEDVAFGWFYGGGAQLETEEHKHHKHHHNDFFFGPSGTIGLFHEFATVPIEVFVKSNLAIYVVESTDAEIDAMLGAHYIF